MANVEPPAGIAVRRATLRGARSAAGGRYVEIGDGVIHVRVEGRSDGVPLLLLHGATVALWEFDRLVPHLLDRGFRVLRFDLLGHGLSDRPRVDYTLERFVRQTVEVLDATSFPRPAAILGHSLGAAIAAGLGATQPDSDCRFVLVAPMLDFRASSPWARAFGSRHFGPELMRRVGVPALVRRRRKRYARIGLAHLAETFREHALLDGYADALASMIRARALGDQAERYARLGRLGPEVLLVAGGADRVIPARDIARLRTMLPRHRYFEIAGAEHNMLLTHAEEVASAVERFGAEPEPLATRVHGVTTQP
jgi:pimeloyl-ACP methyl ester carboxylesterase